MTIHLDTFQDYVRLFNGLLAIMTMVLLATLTWRMAPGMRWFEMTSRQSLALIVFGAAYRNQFIKVVNPAGYSPGVFIYTMGFMLSTISLWAWARTVPRRHWHWPSVLCRIRAAIRRRTSKQGDSK